MKQFLPKKKKKYTQTEQDINTTKQQAIIQIIFINAHRV